MIDGSFTIIENKIIADSVFMIKLSGDSGDIVAGQFVNIKLENFFLRRPISVADVQEDVLTLIYKVVGSGTKALSLLCSGEELKILCGLGNGFTITDHKNPILIGGGVGAPPMLLLAKTLCKMGIKPTVVLGFRTKKDVFLEQELSDYAKKIYITTEDGSYGSKGFVTDVVEKIDCDYFYACGPMPMLKALAKLNIEGQLSYEERMGCGFGGCMGCSCKTTNGEYARICKEGPVFKKGEIKL